MSKNLLRAQGIHKTRSTTRSPRAMFYNPLIPPEGSWAPRGLLQPRGIGKTSPSRWSGPPKAISNNQLISPGVFWIPRLDVSSFVGATMLFGTPHVVLDVQPNIAAHTPHVVPDVQPNIVGNTPDLCPCCSLSLALARIFSRCLSL